MSSREEKSLYRCWRSLRMSKANSGRLDSEWNEVGCRRPFERWYALHRFW